MTAVVAPARPSAVIAHRASSPFCSRNNETRYGAAGIFTTAPCFELSIPSRRVTGPRGCQRFGAHPGFAWAKIAGFLLLQGSLLALVVVALWAIFAGSQRSYNSGVPPR